MTHFYLIGFFNHKSGLWIIIGDDIYSRKKLLQDITKRGSARVSSLSLFHVAKIWQPPYAALILCNMSLYPDGGQ